MSQRGRSEGKSGGKSKLSRGWKSAITDKLILVWSAGMLDPHTLAAFVNLLSVSDTSARCHSERLGFETSHGLVEAPKDD